MQNRPYLLALVGQILFGLHYMVETQIFCIILHMWEECLLLHNIRCASLFLLSSGQLVFNHYSSKLNNKGRTASLFLYYRNFPCCLCFLQCKRITSCFYALSGLTVFFSGFNTRNLCNLFQTVWNGEWKTGLKMTVFSILFHLEIKIGMAVGTALFSRITWKIWLYCKSGTKCNCTFNYKSMHLRRFKVYFGL